MIEWHCEIVDSCTGSPLRVDTLVISPSTGAVAVLRAAPRATGGAPKLFRDASESTPSGETKVRWRCPRGHCSIDLTLNKQTLDRVGKKLRDAGVTSVELAALAVTLS